MEVQWCFSCSVVLKKSSSSSVIFFSLFFKLHSCGRLRHASMYRLLQYFEKCSGHFFKLCTTQNAGVLYGSQVQHSLIMSVICHNNCYLKNEVCIAWKHYDLFLLVYINSKVTEGEKKETRLLKFKNFYVTDLIWQDFWENLSEYMRNVDALVNKEYIKSQNQSGRDAACI